MYNELLFVGHILLVSLSVVVGLWYSYGGLIAVLSLQLILANLFVTKQIILFGIETTCSEVFVVSGMYGIALIRSYYGEKPARNVVWSAFGFLLLFVACARLHCLYVGLDPVVDGAIATVCDATFRLLVASLLAYLVSERAHLWLTRLLDPEKKSNAWQVVAIVGGQIVDTLTFGYVGLYGLVESLWSVMLFCFVVKVVAIVALSPLLVLTRRYLPPAQCDN